MSLTFPAQNNLNWLRLLFALQVCYSHVTLHLKAPFPELLKYFPGVPAFFFVSGFLVYAAYRNAPDRNYYRNRVLRIIPGLLAVTIASCAIVVSSLGFEESGRHWNTFLMWMVAQVTLGQAYNPGLFRGVGVGVMNGSLWSITVEILFYLCIPALCWLEKRWGRALLLMMVISYGFFAIGPRIWTNALYREKNLYDMLALTPLIWGWMFGIGILAYKHFEELMRYAKYFPLLILPIALMVAFGEGPLFRPQGNRLGLLYFLSFAGLIFWLAFYLPAWNLRIDLSYGIYIWHMPVVNLLLVAGGGTVTVAMSMTVLVALVSWYLIERPALYLKRKSLHHT